MKKSDIVTKYKEEGSILLEELLEVNFVHVYFMNSNINNAKKKKYLKFK